MNRLRKAMPRTMIQERSIQRGMRHPRNDPMQVLPKMAGSMTIQILMNCFAHSPNRVPQKTTKMTIWSSHALNLKAAGIN